MIDLYTGVIALEAIAVAEFSIMLCLMVKVPKPIIQIRIGIVFCVCIISYMLLMITRPDTGSSPSLGWYALILLAMTTPVIYWLASKSIFIDDFVLSKQDYWVVGIYELSSIVFLAIDYYDVFFLDHSELLISRWFILIPVIMRGALLFWAIGITIKTWRHDLLERRRNLRIFSALVVGTYILLTLVFEMLEMKGEHALIYELVHSVLIASAGFYFLLSMTHLEFSWFTPVIIDSPSMPNAADNNQAQEYPQPSELIIERWPDYLARISDERLYARHKMTIAKLAGVLDLPEYRLRNQIVQSMSFRNFNQFLNYYRIEEATTRLKSEEESKTPILTIALDVGFGSLPSFNRSFKQTHNMTPSEYRKLQSPILEV